MKEQPSTSLPAPLDPPPTPASAPITHTQGSTGPLAYPSENRLGVEVHIDLGNGLREFQNPGYQYKVRALGKPNPCGLADDYSAHGEGVAREGESSLLKQRPAGPGRKLPHAGWRRGQHSSREGQVEFRRNEVAELQSPFYFQLCL